MTDMDKQLIFNSIEEYCEKYNIPIENLMDILEDQKVLPMIRGKATEYIAAATLKKVLGRNWQVQKLNLNAQAGTYDEDISITHSKTGKRLKVESKNAVRGSFKVGSNRTVVTRPHFRVKCHKSRSHIKKSKTTNDRYLLGDFDLIVCNVSNAIFQGGTLGDELELLYDADAIKCLKKHYNTESDSHLIRCAYDDWRGCFPRSIVLEDKSIPRTPAIELYGDKNWFSLKELETKLLPEFKIMQGKQ